MRRRVLMFDLDGTLADAMPDLIGGLIASFRGTPRGGVSHAEVTDLRCRRACFPSWEWDADAEVLVAAGADCVIGSLLALPPLRARLL